MKYVDKEPQGQSELCFTNLNQNGLSIIFLQLAGLQPSLDTPRRYRSLTYPAHVSDISNR